MNRSDITEEIKKYAPSSLKVQLRDGTDKAVAVPKLRNRWSRTQQVLDSLPWVAIECLDKDGRLIKLIEDDAELDAIGDEVAGEDLGIAKLLLEVMRTTLKEARLMADVQMRAMGQALSAMGDAQNALVETYRAALATQQQYLLGSGQGESDNKEMMTMFQMAMHLMAQQKAAAAKSGGG